MLFTAGEQRRNEPVMSGGFFLRTLPRSLRIANKCVSINTDFRIGLLIRELWQDERLMGREGLAFALTGELLFGEVGWQTVRRTPEAAASAVLWYMSRGHSRLQQGAKRMPDAREMHNRRIFSCFWDEGLLLAAFLAEYGIDLGKTAPGELHFWRFDALFEGLSEHCALKQRMLIRGTDPAQLPDDAARAALAAQQVLYRIPRAERIFSLLSMENHDMCNDKQTTQTCVKEGANGERI